ncbi:MAG TPA: alpha-mannosidase, partial [Candidatus Hydrogenedentes bacterium]|nr:alpha-mannosidase [Candidatus Hydrogenedentota bacterium]
MSKKYVIHVISNTHWDREWLNNFQETRMMLVEFFDLLLEVMEGDDSYTSYVLDSQTVPLEDYLEFRPENRERLAALIEAERLLVGPWYTCPEGFEVNGESLVRNLLMGHRVASGFGHVMKVGHTPFSYGQNSQMPQ